MLPTHIPPASIHLGGSSHQEHAEGAYRLENAGHLRMGQLHCSEEPCCIEGSNAFSQVVVVHEGVQNVHDCVLELLALPG